MVRAWILAAAIMAAGAAPAWAVCRDDHGHFAKCGAGGVAPVISTKMARAGGQRQARAPRVRRPRAPRAPRAPKLFSTRRHR